MINSATQFQGVFRVAKSNGAEQAIAWATDGKLYELGNGTTGASAAARDIEFTIGPLDFGLGQEADFRQWDLLLETTTNITVAMEVKANGGEYTVSHSEQVFGPGVLLGDFILGQDLLGGASFNRVRNTVDLTGRRFDLKVTIAGITAKVNIHSMGLGVQVKKRINRSTEP